MGCMVIQNLDCGRHVHQIDVIPIATSEKRDIGHQYRVPTHTPACREHILVFDRQQWPEMETSQFPGHTRRDRALSNLQFNCQQGFPDGVRFWRGAFSSY
jgi:hypothetical protein